MKNEPTSLTLENNLYGQNTYCQWRLPCGVCEKTNRMCPLSGVFTPNQPTWITTTNTCNATGDKKDE